MFATVTYPYRDRETYEIHRTGDMVELTPERFAELSASGYVDASPIDPMEAADGIAEEPEGEGAGQAEAGAPGPADEPAPEQEEATEPEPAPAAAPEKEMTAQQLRDAIEAKGGFAPKKANKAQLAELLGAL